MKRVGAGLDSNVDDRSRLPAIVGFGTGLHIELLDGVNGQVRGRRSLHAFRIDHSGAVVSVVVVESIDHVVVVFRPISVRGGGEKSATGAALDAGLQNRKVLKVAAEKRQFVDGFIRESPA